VKKYLLWDFDNTLAYRDGMWSQTILELLQESGFDTILLEDIGPYLTKGFPWHTPEIPHEQFFRGLRWWDYMSLYFEDVCLG
jgi:putative hydrolase of the HAD superfamily